MTDNGQTMNDALRRAAGRGRPAPPTVDEPDHDHDERDEHAPVFDMNAALRRAAGRTTHEPEPPAA